jgi:hypothetical protein
MNWQMVPLGGRRCDSRGAGRAHHALQRIRRQEASAPEGVVTKVELINPTPGFTST